jgi:hypothetical protein
MNCFSIPRGAKNAVDKHRNRIDRGRHGIVSDQSLYPDGFQHQDDLERGRSGRRSGLGIAGNRTLGTD